MNFINFIFAEISKGKPLLIALQGASCSGYNEFGNFLEKNMKAYDINYLRIQVVSYGKIYYNTSELNNCYGLHDPALIDWTIMRKTFDDLAGKNELVHRCLFDRKTRTIKPYVVPNTFPKVIILEGSFALNLFNDKILNVSEYDFKEPTTQNSNLIYVDNPNNYSNDFNVFKILFFVEKNEAFKILLKRCIENKNQNEDFCINEFIGEFTQKFKDISWPSIDKWVNTMSHADFIIERKRKKFCNNIGGASAIIFQRLKELNIIPDGD